MNPRNIPGPALILLAVLVLQAQSSVAQVQSQGNIALPIPYQSRTAELLKVGNAIGQATRASYLQDDHVYSSTNEMGLGSLLNYEDCCTSMTCQSETIHSCGSCGSGNGYLCGPSCCSPVWVRAESLLWWLSDDNLPPLVTSSPAGADPAGFGVLGEPNTQTLYDSGDFGDSFRIGGRVTGGFWFDECRRHGLQVDFFGLLSSDQDAAYVSDGNSYLARPFDDMATGVANSQIIGGPGLSSGSLVITGDDQIFSLAPTFRKNLCCTNCCGKGTRVDLLAGYRYFNFEETISLTETLVPTGQFVAPGTTYVLRDRVTTRNDFHGGELGLAYYKQTGNWVFEMAPRVALGTVRRRIDAAGSTRVVVPDVLDETVDGGFYIPTGPTRIVDDEFAVIPQARVGIGYFLSPCFRIHAGYDFIYLSELFRPSSVINSSVNPANLLNTTPVASLPPPRDADAWLQGLSLGFTMNF